MCEQVAVWRDGMETACDTAGELRAALGMEPVFHDGYGLIEDNFCLCCCDVRSTAKAAGMSYHQDEWFWHVLSDQKSAVKVGGTV